MMSEKSARIAELEARIADLERENKILREQTTRDPLTGLLNRTGLRIMIDTHGASATAICMIDLDDFKTINDRYGHHVGDIALVELAETMRHEGCGATLGPESSGIAARLGGDEFVIIFFCGNPERVSKRIIQRFAQPRSIAGHDVISTITMGLLITSGIEDTSEAMRAADALLYGAKSSGKNTIRTNKE